MELLSLFVQSKKLLFCLVHAYMGQDRQVLFGIRARIARDIFDRFEDIPLPLSRFLCFILRSPV